MANTCWQEACDRVTRYWFYFLLDEKVAGFFSKPITNRHRYLIKNYSQTQSALVTVKGTLSRLKDPEISYFYSNGL